MPRSTLAIVLTSSFAVLSACNSTGTGTATTTSGGGTGATTSGTGATTGGTGTTARSSYEKLESRAEITSTLGGAAFRVNTDTGTFDVMKTSGRITHNTGALTISDDDYTFNAPDGPDSNGTRTDENDATLTFGGSRANNLEDNRNYDYVTVYQEEYSTDDGTPYTVTGVEGVITNTSDVPTSGSATYTGEAEAVISSATQFIELNKGTSKVSADFAAGTVDATMNNFALTASERESAAAVPIDTITVKGMTIEGNRFSGGTLVTSKAGTEVSVTGANTTTTSQGAFFGYDPAISAPDEVGGVVLSHGDSGDILDTFIAD